MEAFLRSKLYFYLKVMLEIDFNQKQTKVVENSLRIQDSKVMVPAWLEIIKLIFHRQTEIMKMTDDVTLIYLGTERNRNWDILV